MPLLSLLLTLSPTPIHAYTYLLSFSSYLTSGIADSRTRGHEAVFKPVSYNNGFNKAIVDLKYYFRVV